MNFIYGLHQTMISQKLILGYRGDFTQETTKSILAEAECSLDSSGEDSGIKRKVIHVMVEALQNIVKHNNGQGLNAGSLINRSAIFMISKDDLRYCVMTGNPIPKSTVAKLTENLNLLNSKDKEGLKETYKEIIKNTQISDKGGAGLGFVDMARKSAETLEFVFPEVDADRCFFCLKVNISREKE